MLRCDACGDAVSCETCLMWMMRTHARHSYHLIQICGPRSWPTTRASCNDLIEQVQVVCPVYAPVEPIFPGPEPPGACACDHPATLRFDVYGDPHLQAVNPGASPIACMLSFSRDAVTCLMWVHAHQVFQDFHEGRCDWGRYQVMQLGRFAWRVAQRGGSDAGVRLVPNGRRHMSNCGDFHRNLMHAGCSFLLLPQFRLRNEWFRGIVEQ
jgi:hypothetical protein